MIKVSRDFLKMFNSALFDKVVKATMSGHIEKKLQMVIGHVIVVIHLEELKPSKESHLKLVESDKNNLGP